MAKKKEVAPKKEVKTPKQKPKEVVEIPQPVNQPTSYPQVEIGTGHTSDIGVRKVVTIDSKDMRRKTGIAGVIHPKRVLVIHPKRKKADKIKKIENIDVEIL